MQTKMAEWSARRIRRRAAGDHLTRWNSALVVNIAVTEKQATAVHTTALVPLASRPMSGPMTSIAAAAISCDQPRRSGFGRSTAGLFAWATRATDDHSTYRSVGVL